MPKYMKNSTVVQAQQMVSEKDMGELGSLVTEDWVLWLADGAIHTMNSTDFAAKYTSVSDKTTLTGDDWD